MPGLTWLPGVDRDPFGHDDVEEDLEAIAEVDDAHLEDGLAEPASPAPRARAYSGGITIVDG